ncbi:hypothetical protein FDC35_05460 [Clostridium botulinum]|nr:hypothetical protein [Clostridium botulinum]NFP00346.1 hypothetical protein [Clostridium botulinum]
MPEGGRYEKMPRPESIQAFIKYVSSKPFVKDIEVLDTQIFEVKRENKSNITVFLTNIYVVSQADVIDILTEYPNIDCIVTVSAWNKYAESAKIEAKENNIGLFKFKEFLGAVYYDGQEFIDYKPKARNATILSKRMVR